MLNIRELNYFLDYNYVLNDLKNIKNDILFVDLKRKEINILSKRGIISMVKGVIMSNNIFLKNLIKKENVVGWIKSIDDYYGKYVLNLYIYNENFLQEIRNLFTKCMIKDYKIWLKQSIIEFYKFDNCLNDLLNNYVQYQFNKDVENYLRKNYKNLLKDFEDGDLFSYYNEKDIMTDLEKLNFLLYQKDIFMKLNIEYVDYYYNLQKYFFRNFNANVENIDKNFYEYYNLLDLKEVNNKLIVGLNIFQAINQSYDKTIKIYKKSDYVKNDFLNNINLANVYIYTFIPVISLYKKLMLFQILYKYDMDNKFYKYLIDNKIGEKYGFDYLGIPLILKL